MRKRIALSGWMAYLPFRAARAALDGIDVDLVDGAEDRVEGLAEGRYAACPLSTYALVEALPKFDAKIGVAWICVIPVGDGSDRIVCRSDIESVGDLHRARIGLCASGLEVHLFEHIFDANGFPPKRDYIDLPDRSHYVAAFNEGRVDVVMAPQPNRSLLLNQNPDAGIFQSDVHLQRHGLYVPFVYRRTQWTPVSLAAVCSSFVQEAKRIASLDNQSVREIFPRSFEGIAAPAAELKDTLHWPSVEECVNYMESSGANSFEEHLLDIADFRVRRFGAPKIPKTAVTSLVR